VSYDPAAIWPRGSTDLLLRTALHADPAAARAAWTEWCAHHDLDSAPWMDVRLAALVGARLPELGIDSPLQPVLKGITRHIWAHAQSRFAATRPLLAAWQAAGIPMLALKGFARIVAEPALAARRYIGDIDILLRPEDWARAIDVAAAAGWHAKNGWPDETVKTRMRHRRHSISLLGATPVELDLHRFALLDNRCRDEDAGVWQRAREGRYAEMPFMVPAPADRAVIACGHGSVFEDAESAQADWIVDTAAAFAAPGMDWSAFEAETRRRALAPQVLGALTYLRALGHAVPAGLVARLRADCPEPLVERLLHQRRGRAGRRAPDHARIFRAAEELRAQRACAANPDWTTAGTASPTGRAVPVRNGRLFELPVPGGIAPGDAVELVLRIEPGELRRGERLALEVQLFEVFAVELARWRAPLKGRVSPLMGRPRLRIAVPAPLLVAREADIVRVQVRNPLRPRSSPPEARALRGVGYAWRVTPG
jgi:hypothetical protein